VTYRAIAMSRVLTLALPPAPLLTRS
jgi:hypothetical protein